MAILEKEVWVGFSSKTSKYYEGLGYEFDKYKDKNGKLRIKRGSTILVKINDLSEGSNVFVTKICDICGKHVKQKYCGILICRENNTSRIDKCDECSSRETGVRKGIANDLNCVANTHPNFAKLFWDKEDTYRFTYSSGKKVNFKCPECGNKLNKQIDNVFKQGLSCHKCSDTIPYSEKFIFNMLQQLNINFCYQMRFVKWFPKDNKKFYDFYLPDFKIIIETHGKQHYEGSFEGYGENARSLNDEIENDKYKFEKAIENGIPKNNYIVIDARISLLDHIKNSILQSNLQSVLDLSNVNWNLCHQYACKSIVKHICDLWKKYKNLSKIGEISKLERHTIARYLRQGAEIGWCDYDPEVTKKSPKEVVQLTLNGDFVNSFSSQKEAERICGIRASRISRVCNGYGNNAGGYKWMMKSDYESVKEELNDRDQ